MTVLLIASALFLVLLVHEGRRRESGLIGRRPYNSDVADLDGRRRESAAD